MNKQTQELVINLGTDRLNEQAPCTKVKINGNEISALADSGAFASIIGTDLAKQFPRIENIRITLRSLSGNIIENEGVTLVPIQIGQVEITYPLVLVKGYEGLLLGWDFAETFKMKIDAENQTLSSPIFGESELTSEKQDILQKFIYYNMSQ